ncbi:MAG: hypothetical protein CL916_09980 [Deltaproteobacteria bacterium]|nr:hypothetical protein [Deltaproteobacteria bacterium]
MSNSISDLKLEQWLLGELSEKEAHTIESAIREDEQLRSRIDEMKVQNRLLFQEHPTAKFEADLNRKIHLQNTQKKYKKNQNQRFGRIIAGALAFCVALFIVISPSSKELLSSKHDPAYRLKGEDIHLIAHRVESEVQSQLFDGNAIQSGDQIQLSIKNAKNRSFVIFSLDGRGVISLHYPIEHNGRLEKSDFFSLPTSYRLDDAPKFESFYLVASKEVLEKEKILAKARKVLSSSDFPKDFQALLPINHTFNRISLHKKGN